MAFRVILVVNHGTVLYREKFCLKHLPPLLPLPLIKGQFPKDPPQNKSYFIIS